MTFCRVYSAALGAEAGSGVCRDVTHTEGMLGREKAGRLPGGGGPRGEVVDRSCPRRAWGWR